MRHFIFYLGTLIIGWSITPLGLAKSDLEKYGDFMAYALPSSAGAVALLKKDYAGFGQMGVSTFGTILTVDGLKMVVDKERPRDNGGCNSFPSGHAGSAFVGAANYHYRYGWQYGLPAYVLAAGVAYSRVDAEAHYWEDVLASLVIANAWAYVFVDSQSGVSLMPMFDVQKKNFGLMASVGF